MTDSNQTPGGSENGDAGGETGNAKAVSHETHTRLLGQYKKAQAEREELQKQLNALAEEKKKAEDDVLASKGDFKNMVEARDKKINELTQALNDTKSTLGEREKVIQDSRKLSAFNSKLPAPLKRSEYYAFVDLDSIVVDTEGKIDETSLEKVVSDFVSVHGEILLQKNPGKMPGDAANGKATLTYEEWQKLPAKDQRKRLKELAPAAN